MMNKALIYAGLRAGLRIQRKLYYALKVLWPVNCVLLKQLYSFFLLVKEQRMFSFQQLKNFISSVGFPVSLVMIFIIFSMSFITNSDYSVKICIDSKCDNPVKVGTTIDDTLNENDTDFPGCIERDGSSIVVGIIELLKKINVFKGLNDKALFELSSIADRRIYDSGSIVLYQGDIGNSAYIVANGRLKAFLKNTGDREKTLKIFESGSYFGELTLFGEGMRTAFVKAMSKCELLMIPKDRFLQLIENYPIIAINILGGICHTLADTNEQLGDSYFIEVDQRIAKSLLYLSKYASINTKGQKVIKNLPITEIAYITGTTRPTASKIINGLKNDGYIDVNNKDIIILRNDLYSYAV